jgi:histidine ammonia-lyase
VVVAGEAVGAVATVALDDATERTIWTNSTVALVIEGPTGSTRPFFDAFPF